MSNCYSVTVQIDGCNRSRMEAVEEAVMAQWDIECCVHSWESPLDGTLGFMGELCLYAGEAPDNFTSRLSEAVWQANRDYCDVEVEAVGEEDSTAGECIYTVTLVDYWDWKNTGMLPHVTRTDVVRAQLAAA